ncbi:MAG: fatty acyl-AMP ligase [Gemmatimonadaceae bacterium]
MSSQIPPSELLTVPASLERAAKTSYGATFVGPKLEERQFSYRDLLARAKEIASSLSARGVEPGDRVAFALPSEEEFVTTYLGTLIAGAVAVPLAPPLGIGKLGTFLDAASRMLSTSRAKLFITSKSIRAMSGSLREAVPSLGAIVSCADLGGTSSSYRPPVVRLDDLAMLQFTSGSTSEPKGVRLTHRNLAANCWVIVREGLRAAAPDRCVSWLPLFHDMGMIGMVLCPIYSEIPLTLMPPTLFATKPAAWFKLLSDHQGTITYAPNFAYAYATKRIRDAELTGVNLSHVRVFGCGAEPINPLTLNKFVERFASVGARLEAFYPSYGMAESSLAVSFGRGVRTDTVSADDLESAQRASRVPKDDEASGTSTRELVACGSAFTGHSIRIVDPMSGTLRQEREIGEIRIAGPSVTDGYFEATEATQALFDEERFLRTGDLGYFADGQLHICGRIKDLIIVRGRNCAPQDLEWEAASVDGVRSGAVAAFSIPGSEAETESVVIVAEAKADADASRVVSDIRTRLLDSVGITVAVVELVPAGTLPKTTSGKLRRAEIRARYLRGELVPPNTQGVQSALKHLLVSQWGHLKSAISSGLPERNAQS